MRTATPTLRCIARSSYLAPSNAPTSTGKPLETRGSLSRLPIHRTYSHCPPTRFSQRSALSKAWLAPNSAPREDHVPLQELTEDPSPVGQSHWSFFSNASPDIDETDLYGKWQWLSEDQEKLSYEAGVLAPDNGYSRFVDWPKHENDINLWSCILDFRARKDGAAGVAAVLEGLMRRRNLRDMDGRVAERFWGKILAAAVEDVNMLNNVWVYAEWLHHDHGVEWPNLYWTTISSFLQRRLPHEAMIWHLRLSPDFGLDTATFLKLMKQSITVPDKLTQYILQNLYIASAHRGLYDELISHLYSQGCLTLANKWRRLLLYRNDGPTSQAARAFVRFRAAYFPNELIPKSEVIVASLDGDSKNHITVKNMGDGSFRFKDVKMGSLQAQNVGIDGNGLRYLINKVHGQTFGIEEKVYDDTLGARWFASSWVSVDSTISTVQMLGFNSVGPLSLQSIALREQKPDRILHRIEQLAAAGISITESSYTRAVRYFAATGDDLLLESLLQSDIHPDVFDDMATQRKILDSVVVTGNWKQHELIMAVRLAVSQHNIATASNDLLQICLRRRKRAAVIDILDMNAGAVQLSEQSERTSDIIAHHILHAVSPNVWRRGLQKPLSGFYAAVFKRLMPMQFPLPVSALHIILARLGRDGLLEDLEQLSMGLVQQYHDIRHSQQHHLTNFHKFDLPTVIQQDGSHSNSSSNFQLVPHDLELSHKLHPVSQLFDRPLQAGIVRWGFRRGYYLGARMDRPHVFDLMEPKHFHFARGIRLLAMLRDKGLTIYLREVRQLVMIRIAELFLSGRLTAIYGREMRKRGIKEPHLRTRFVLDEVYATCEEAWQTLPANGKVPPKPLLDRSTMLKTIQAWRAIWKQERPQIFARRLQIHPPERGGPMSVAKKREYLLRRGDEGYRWVFGNLPRF